MSQDRSYPWVDAGDGVRRRVLAQTPDAMTVQVEFPKGAVGPPHSHPHTQTVFVKAGRFAFTIDGVEREVTAGDSLVIPPDAVHGCVALEDGTLIDGFFPRRDDFL